MSLIANNITETIGNTPLVRINRVTDQQATVLAKLESFNPASSVKDRIAVAIVDAAEASGQLLAGGKIVEATSGNTGVALAMVGAARGYQVVICMPSSMSIERRVLMRAFGAELILTDPKLGMQGAVAAAEELVANSEGAVLASQFVNPANPATHTANTGKEIWEATGGKVDILVAGVGTGGTISGAGGFLKKMQPDLQVVAIEPADSPLLSTGQAGPHGIQGIGANFIPQNLDREILDEVLQAPTEAALEFARRAAAEEGLLVGISAGAALWGAAQLASRPENAGKTIVTVLPDTGERYLSTPLWSHFAE
ncbi:cysteine synthase A [Gleimia sp. 6138-11-ORH1]|uniref:cysteine synthase A n=1 Tax=Gleimia sp. 6138-11-ORH1 TaxID=2973937 RepID=UPI00216A8A60|nr:cysteine synthase A [Gleimia sp. 6138-11-ORH1]MCS4484912.1 cysteine synthase A [Gleimia sp. 6138-11-ORH1]